MGPTLLPRKPNRPKNMELPDRLSDADFILGCSFSTYELSIWLNLLKQPIQRGYADYNFPLSFEILLLKVRTEDARRGCPANVREYIQTNMELFEDVKEKLLEYWGILISLPIPIYYTCPTCRANI